MSTGPVAPPTITDAESYWAFATYYAGSVAAFVTKFGGCSEAQVLTLIATRDRALVAACTAAWEASPDTPSVREEVGFFPVCDLCSEAWALDPPDPEA